MMQLLSSQDISKAGFLLLGLNFRLLNLNLFIIPILCSILQHIALVVLHGNDLLPISIILILTASIGQLLHPRFFNLVLVDLLQKLI